MPPVVICGGGPVGLVLALELGPCPRQPCVPAGIWLRRQKLGAYPAVTQRHEEAGENPARSRHCDRAVLPGSQTFCRCQLSTCQGRVIPKELSW